jgi:hypothetical protein
MAGGAGRIGGLIATLLLGQAAVAWAGSSQALLTVGAVVPARCAVRMPGSLKTSEATASLSRETVAMRCTKGTLPSAGASGPSAVGPRISRDLVLPAAAPRPLIETGSPGPRMTGPRLVVTVDF